MKRRLALAAALTVLAFPASAAARHHPTHYVGGLPAHRVWDWPHYNCVVPFGPDGAVVGVRCVWDPGGWRWVVYGAPGY